MSSLRQDVTTNDWVVFAPDRARRPDDYGKRQPATDGSAAESHLCPFCPGNEAVAGPEIYAVRNGTAPNSPGWQVRVIPNRFPALRIEDSSARKESGSLFRSTGGCGAHEVIIETPDHQRSIADRTVDEVELLVKTLQVRFIDLLRDHRFQSIVIFKNHGSLAGASLQHPHCQLIATPVVPQQLRLKHHVAMEFFDRTGECLYCELLSEELEAGDRLVAENSEFAAICPFASRLPFEVWILPKHHRASFAIVPPQSLRLLAELIRTVLRRLHVGLENPDYNLTVNTSPRGDEEKPYFLWHIQILPRLTMPAGFELGSGMAINTVMPEVAARFLRELAF